jgi:hypothetical protein
MKSRFMIPALLAAVTFSAGAFAHGGDRDNDWCGQRWNDQRYERRMVHVPPPPVYGQPRGYYPAPRVVYAQPVVYRPAPVYYAEPPMPRDPQRVVAQTIGAVAGGVIGHQVGDGQLAPTLIGAVIGGVIGDQFAR